MSEEDGECPSTLPNAPGGEVKKLNLFYPKGIFLNNILSGIDDESESECTLFNVRF